MGQQVFDEQIRKDHALAISHSNPNPKTSELVDLLVLESFLSGILYQHHAYQ